MNTTRLQGLSNAKKRQRSGDKMKADFNRRCRLESLEGREMFSVGIAHPVVNHHAGLAPASVPAIVQPLATPTGTVAEPPDFSNTPAQAKLFKLDRSGSAVIKGNITKNDVDWLKFQATGKKMYVQTNYPALFVIYNSNMQPIANGASYQATFNVKPGQTYFVRITGYWAGQTVKNYNVSLQTLPARAASTLAAVDSAFSQHDDFLSDDDFLSNKVMKRRS
jgi:hypothetical protein